MSRTLTGWSFWGTRGSRGTEAPARQPGTHVNPLQRAGPIRVRAEIPSATRKRPFLNHAYFSVIVVVTPARRFGRDRLGQAGSDRHVLEDPASLVPQQREPCWLFPAPRISRTSRLPSLSKSAWATLRTKIWSPRFDQDERSSKAP